MDTRSTPSIVGRERTRRIRVVVVDHSPVVRGLLSEAISHQHDLELVGVAPDPLVARELIREGDADVVTLDVRMARMDGLEFLRRLMHLRPMPVVMASTETTPGAAATREALALGAAAVVARPGTEHPMLLRMFVDEVLRLIRQVAIVPARAATPAGIVDIRAPRRMRGATEAAPIIAIGASTGGTEAILAVLAAMPEDAPAVVITQHMPERYMRAFAWRLDRLCPIRVKEAEHGEPVVPGRAYLATGDRHLLVERDAAGYRIALSTAPAVNRHRPSVEVMFRSLAQVAHGRVVAVMLTGMGRDGAEAMLTLRRLGAITLAQDAATCVVFGMPKEAIALGAVDEVLPLDQIAARALDACKPGRRTVPAQDVGETD